MRTYFRLLAYAAPYRWRFLAAFGCMAVLALATAMYVNLLGPVLEFLFTGQVGAMGALARLLPGDSAMARGRRALTGFQALGSCPGSSSRWRW